MAIIPSTPDEEKAFEESASSTLGVIFEFLKRYNEYFGSYLAAVPPSVASGLPSEELKTAIQATNPHGTFEIFSDTLIVYFSAVDAWGRYQWRAIHTLLVASATRRSSLGDFREKIEQMILLIPFWNSLDRRGLEGCSRKGGILQEKPRLTDEF